MIRNPGLEFLSRGPPADLAARRRTFSSRIEMCREKAEKLAGRLTISRFDPVDRFDGMAQAALHV